MAVAILLLVSTTVFLVGWTSNTFEKALESLRKDYSDNIIIVQVQKSQLRHAMNLVCSAARRGIPKSQFIMWVSDYKDNQFISKKGINSFYDSSNGTNEYKAQIWLSLLQSNVSFWWIEPETVLLRSLHMLPDTAHVTFMAKSTVPFTKGFLLQNFYSVDNGDILPNSKLFFARAAGSTIQFFKRVYDLTISSNIHLDDALNQIVRDASFSALSFDSDPQNGNGALGSTESREPFKFSYFEFATIWGLDTTNGKDLKINHPHVVTFDNATANLLPELDLWFIDNDMNCL
jgi:hypothetical protein